MLYKEAEPIEKELAEIVVENGMVYHLAEDGCYYSEKNAKQNTDYPVGKYGMMRGEYLMENDRHRCFRMVLDGTWNEYLHGVDEECYRELEMAVKRTKEKEGVTEDLKSENPMLWVGKVNNIMAGAEEEILREIIYVYEMWAVLFVRTVLFFDKSDMLNIFVDYIKVIVYTISCMEEMCNDNIRTD